MLTDGAVRQFSGREFQRLGAATEKRRAAVSKLCGGTDRNCDLSDLTNKNCTYMYHKVDRATVYVAYLLVSM